VQCIIFTSTKWAGIRLATGVDTAKEGTNSDHLPSVAKPRTRRWSGCTFTASGNQENNRRNILSATDA